MISFHIYADKHNLECIFHFFEDAHIQIDHLYDQLTCIIALASSRTKTVHLDTKVTVLVQHASRTCCPSGACCTVTVCLWRFSLLLITVMLSKQKEKQDPLERGELFLIVICTK